MGEPATTSAEYVRKNMDGPLKRAAKPHIDKQTLDYVVRSGIAGGVAGCVAKTAIAPLDRVKILFQTNNPQFVRYTGSWLGFARAGRAIIGSEGAFGLFRGHSATLLRIFPYAAIKFVAYEQIRYLLIPNPAYETNIRRALSGSLAGMLSVCITYPLDLVRVRLAFDTAPNPLEGRLVKIVKQVYAEDSGPRWSKFGLAGGIANFYRGFFPTILGMVPYAGVSFWAHDVFHDIFRSRALERYAVNIPDEYTGGINPTDSANKYDHDTRPQLKAWAQLTAGGLSGMCAQTSAYPLEVIRRRMQVSAVVGSGARHSLWYTAKEVVAQRGLQGLFVGLSIGYIKIIPMFACSFFVYERMKEVVGI